MRKLSLSSFRGRRLGPGPFSLGFLLLSVAVSSAAELGTADPKSAQDQDGAALPERVIEKAGALFRSSCIDCHLPPDPTRATDLAWLGEVNDTA